MLLNIVRTIYYIYFYSIKIYAFNMVMTRKACTIAHPVIEHCSVDKMKSLMLKLPICN